MSYISDPQTHMSCGQIIIDTQCDSIYTPSQIREFLSAQRNHCV